MFVDFDEVFKNFVPQKPILPPKYLEVICGSLTRSCYTCKHNNPNIKKNYEDEVLCVQKNGICTEIKIMCVEEHKLFVED